MTLRGENYPFHLDGVLVLKPAALWGSANSTAAENAGRETLAAGTHIMAMLG